MISSEAFGRLTSAARRDVLGALATLKNNGIFELEIQELELSCVRGMQNEKVGELSRRILNAREKIQAIRGLEQRIDHWKKDQDNEA